MNLSETRVHSVILSFSLCALGITYCVNDHLCFAPCTLWVKRAPITDRLLALLGHSQARHYKAHNFSFHWDSATQGSYATISPGIASRSRLNCVTRNPDDHHSHQMTDRCPISPRPLPPDHRSPPWVTLSMTHMLPWSTCPTKNGPRGYLLLTSSTTDDRPDQYT